MIELNGNYKNFKPAKMTLSLDIISDESIENAVREGVELLNNNNQIDGVVIRGEGIENFTINQGEKLESVVARYKDTKNIKPTKYKNLSDAAVALLTLPNADLTSSKTSLDDAERLCRNFVQVVANCSDIDFNTVTEQQIEVFKMAMICCGFATSEPIQDNGKQIGKLSSTFLYNDKMDKTVALASKILNPNYKHDVLCESLKNASKESDEYFKQLNSASIQMAK